MNEPNKRRRKSTGSVTVLVVVVLALIFILGSVLLFTARFERTTAIESSKTLEMRSIHQAMTHRIMLQLRGDIVGTDGSPYN